MADDILNEYLPETVTPPGESVDELLEEWHMTQAQLAERMGRPKKTINEIIKGKTAITPETALQFEKVFGVPASFWLTRERQYREFLARKEELRQLKREHGWLAKFPIKEMIRFGWLKAGVTELETVKALWAFFGVAGHEPWRAVYGEAGLAFRKSSRAEPAVLAAWLRQGERLARGIQTRPYDERRFRMVLRAIRGLTLIPPAEAQKTLVARCSEVGLAVVFVQDLPRAGVSGATRWLGSDKALVQLSLRYKTNDHLWFTFFHEAGHILLHGKRETFLEEIGNARSEDEKELEANAFACEQLIPRGAYEAFKTAGSFSETNVERFAEEQGIAPGIVVGRLQHDRVLRFSQLTHLKQKLIWDEHGCISADE